MIEHNPNIKAVHILNKPPEIWKGHTGYITTDIVKNEVADYEERTFYICGPPRMVDVMLELLKKLDIKKIKIERFPGY